MWIIGCSWLVDSLNIVGCKLIGGWLMAVG